VRTFSFSIVLLLMAAAGAQAAVTTYPSPYHPNGTDYYENLRIAKVSWLRMNAAAVASELATDKTALANLNGKAAIDAKGTIDRLTALAAQINAEIVVMHGARDSGQEALLKRNVQSWIGAARRGGNGAEAIRLMHDLEGTGL
jgi:hypothetical protein